MKSITETVVSSYTTVESVTGVGPLLVIPIAVLLGRILLLPFYVKWRMDQSYSELSARISPDKVKLIGTKIDLMRELNEITDHGGTSDYIYKDNEINEMSSKLKKDAYAFMGISIWSVPILFLHIQHLSIVNALSKVLENHNFIFLDSNLFLYNNNVALLTSKYTVAL